MGLRDGLLHDRQPQFLQRGRGPYRRQAIFDNRFRQRQSSLPFMFARSAKL